MSVELQHIRRVDDNPSGVYLNDADIMDANGKTKDGGYNNPAFVKGSNDDVTVAMEAVELTEEFQPYVSEPLEDEPSGCAGNIKRVIDAINDFFDENSKVLWRLFYTVLICLYAAYFGYAMYYSFGDEGSIRLLWVTCLVLFFVIIHLISRFFGESISNGTQGIQEKMSDNSEMISWIVVGIIWLAIIIFIIVDVAVISKNPYNLVSIVGIVVYVLLLFIFSYAPERVQWRPVAWGLALQFIMAILILKWDFGYQAFQWLGDRVSEFLAHSDAGAEFIFGQDYLHHFFAFKVLPVIIFFSTAISVLYYLGVMQVVIRKIAWIMQVTMGTTAAESLNAAGNIFIGQTEAPLLIRPLVQNMTRSELHAVMTGGFATIAGSVLAAYILFGVPANHLISASVMSAPAALAMSKLFYPETEKSKTTAEDVKTMEKTKDRNIIEAASSGASASIALVANIAANLIAFLAILHFLNATLMWFGARIGWLPPDIEFTFQFIMSYLLYPFAFIMGTAAEDCRTMARLIGVKTFLNEFVAYNDLGIIVNNKVLFDAHVAMNGTFHYVGDNIVLDAINSTLTDPKTSILVGGIFFSERSLTIATYALCGFANFGSIGVMLGGLTAMAPHRRADLSAVALRAMIAGNVACFMTACIAGVFFQPGL